VPIADHFPSLSALLASGWPLPTTLASSASLWQSQPFQLGFAAVAFCVLAVWLWLRRVGGEQANTGELLLRFGAVGALVIVLLTLPLAEVLWRSTRAEQLLTYPWQLLLLAAPLLAVVAGSLPALNSALARTPLWLTLVGIALLGGFPYLHADYTQTLPPRAPIATFGDAPALVLLAADLDEGVEATTLDVTWQVLQPLPFDYNLFFQAVIAGDAAANVGEQVVAQLDTQPHEGTQPATTWRVGTIMTDTYTLAMPSNLPAGEVRYYFGYYDWRDGARLPVDGGRDDKLILPGE
jgi:hypothetical protein